MNSSLAVVGMALIRSRHHLVRRHFLRFLRLMMVGQIIMLPGCRAKGMMMMMRGLSLRLVIMVGHRGGLIGLI